MGSLFSKPKPSRVTQQDKAVLQLKQQRDRLKQYQKKVETNIGRDVELARCLLKDGKKERAKLLLRKKKFQEQLLSKTDIQLENLETLVHDIEFAQIEIQVINGLKAGNEALKKVHEVLNIDEIEKIMDETREGVEKQKEIDELLSGVLTQEEEDSVLDELDEIIKSSLPEVPEDSVQNMPNVPEDKRAVPSENPKRKKEKVAMEA